MSDTRASLRPEPGDAPSRPATTRRGALQAAVRFTAAMTAIGASATTFLGGRREALAAQEGGGGPQCTSEDAVHQLIQHALDTQDMQEAIALYGESSGLSAESLATLDTITSDEQAIAEYLTVVLEENDPAALADALGTVARARGMTEIAKASGMTREALYKALRADAHPRFETISRVCAALGVKLVAQVAHAS